MEKHCANCEYMGRDSEWSNSPFYCAFLSGAHQSGEEQKTRPASAITECTWGGELEIHKPDEFYCACFTHKERED